MVINKTEVTPHNIRYDKGDYFVCGAPGQDVTIAVMCVPEVPTPCRITLTWETYLKCREVNADLGICMTARVWRDIHKGMYEDPLETHMYDRERSLYR